MESRAEAGVLGRGLAAPPPALTPPLLCTPLTPRPEGSPVPTGSWPPVFQWAAGERGAARWADAGRRILCHRGQEAHRTEAPPDQQEQSTRAPQLLPVLLLGSQLHLLVPVHTVGRALRLRGGYSCPLPGAHVPGRGSGRLYRGAEAREHRGGSATSVGTLPRGLVLSAAPILGHC